MSLSNTASNKITALANKILGLITTHAAITGSSQQKGHVQSSSQAGLKDISGGAAGTDNGIYARADHQHILSDAYATANHTHNNYINPTIADNLTTNDSTQVLSAKQGKILKDQIGEAITYINQ